MASLWALFLATITLSTTANAGLFNIPQFLNPDQMSFGLEPEFTFTHGAGMGGNVKITRGLGPYTNGTFGIGTGGGNRRFRIGGDLTFDFIPDIDDQPGIGVAGSLYYYNMRENGRTELTAIPYISKTFTMQDQNSVSVFAGFPFGVGVQTGDDKTLMTFATGSIVKASESFSYVLELGIAVSNTDSYISGGVIFTP